MYSLRAATADDLELCFDLHAAAMGSYVAAVWGWDDDVQHDFHVRGFDPAKIRIVTVDGRDLGVLIVEYAPHEIVLGRIELHPDAQGRGIGTALIREVLAEGAASGRPVALEVLTVNPRAQALYERLGFREVGRSGVKVRMRH
ncbi:GNAT family N-acetyltransferase [Micromonospora sp. CPCC 205371]|nr:GNAT family N-acetyltransferase [Micromonospora sp. CPCC 205371]